MAGSPSPRALAILYGFSVVLFCCLQPLGTATMVQASPWGLERLAATVIFPAVLLTLVLTPLLAFAHVGALGGGGAAGDRLAKVTVLVATVALVSRIVVQLGADGHLDRGRGDVARLNIK